MQNLPVTTIQLERLKVAINQRITTEAMTDVEVIAEPFADIISATLRRDVYAHRLASFRYVDRMPKNWWQHLKADLGFRHKTVEQSTTMTRFRTYPDADVVLPPDKMGVSVLQEWRYDSPGPSPRLLAEQGPGSGDLP